MGDGEIGRWGDGEMGRLNNEHILYNRILYQAIWPSAPTTSDSCEIIHLFSNANFFSPLAKSS
nr:hypothetical protein [Okeania sp. SIO2C9]